MPHIAIDQTICKRDGLCNTVCPMNVYTWDGKQSFPGVMREELCISCGHCVAVCPQEAITHSDIARERISPALPENLPLPGAVAHLLRVRRSVRIFKEMLVQQELIEQVIQAAQCAPSGHNVQSTEYVVVQDEAIRRQISQITLDYYKKIAGIFGNSVLRPMLPLFLGNRYENFELLAREFKTLVEVAGTSKDVILHSAPVLIIFHARQTAIFAGTNANLAAQNAALMAQSLGLGAFYLGYVVTACESDSRILRLLEIPKNHRIYAGLALGHPAVRFINWIERETPKTRWI